MSLIQRLEQLTGPDREVDAYIELVIEAQRRGLPIELAEKDLEYVCGRVDGQQIAPGVPETAAQAVCRTLNPIRYTSSIDAALTLVQNGWEWLRESPETMCAYLPKHDDEKSWAIHITGAHKSPAIALCIAALKARGVK